MKNTGKILLKIPAVLTVGGIWFFSSRSILPRPPGIFGFDKFQHLLTYGLLALTIALWFSRETWRAGSFAAWFRAGVRRSPAEKSGKIGRCGALLLTFALASAYGVIDEIHQSFVPGRTCTLPDWIADTIGAFLGAVLVLFLVKKIYK
jgi:VanZ family protein